MPVNGLALGALALAAAAVFSRSLISFQHVITEFTIVSDLSGLRSHQSLGCKPASVHGFGDNQSRDFWFSSNGDF